MTGQTEHDRSLSVVVGIVAVCWIVAIAWTDTELGSAVYFPALLAVAPAIAALALRPLGTALIAGASFVTAIVLGWPDHYMLSAEHLVACSTVLLVGALSITTAVLRLRLEESRAHIVVLATTDALTGVLNRRAFLEQGQALVAVRDRPSSWVLMLDIDHFKNINDRYGHLAGDSVLAETAKRAAGCLREGDLFGRYGGEEFVALLQGGPASDVSRAAERILDVIRAEHVHTQEGEIGVTVSGGLSAVASDERDLWAAVARADDALYRSKEDGRDRLSVEQAAGV